MTTLTVPVPDSAPTFAGADRCNNLETLDAEIAIIGVPYGVVYPSYTDRPPYSEGANAIRQHSGKFGRFRSRRHHFQRSADSDCGLWRCGWSRR